ncbi:MAG: ribosome silencing factor [Thermodesulfobacteriota bacterium]
MTTDILAEVEPYIAAVTGKKAENVVLLDVRGLTSIADAFIICCGNSSRQVTALADHIVTTLKKQGIRPLSSEGLEDGRWALLDYGHVIIHVFYESVRAFYDIEGLWSDARRIDIAG